jgi:hypothetical protein
MAAQEVRGQTAKDTGIEITAGEDGRTTQIGRGTTEKAQAGIGLVAGSSLAGKTAAVVTQQEGTRENQQAQSRPAQTVNHH